MKKLFIIIMTAALLTAVGACGSPSVQSTAEDNMAASESAEPEKSAATEDNTMSETEATQMDTSPVVETNEKEPDIKEIYLAGGCFWVLKNSCRPFPG